MQRVSEIIDLFSKEEDENEERLEELDQANAEVSTYLSLCYMLVEVNLKTASLRDEFSSEPVPFSAFLFGLVDRLGEGNRKHYPVKKVSLKNLFA